MSIINDSNIIDVQDNTLVAGQRAMRLTLGDGSTIIVPVGVGSFVAGGKVYVEAMRTVTDTFSTSKTISNLDANTRYVFEKPLTSLNIISVTDSVFESVIQFSTASSVTTIDIPASVGFIGSTTLEPDSHYIISIRNSIAVIAKYEPGV